MVIAILWDIYRVLMLGKSKVKTWTYETLLYDRYVQ